MTAGVPIKRAKAVAKLSEIGGAHEILLKELKKHEAKNMRHLRIPDAMKKGRRYGRKGDAILLLIRLTVTVVAV